MYLRHLIYIGQEHISEPGESSEFLRTRTILTMTGLIQNLRRNKVGDVIVSVFDWYRESVIDICQ